MSVQNAHRCDVEVCVWQAVCRQMLFSVSSDMMQSYKPTSSLCSNSLMTSRGTCETLLNIVPDSSVLAAGSKVVWADSANTGPSCDNESSIPLSMSSCMRWSSLSPGGACEERLRRGRSRYSGRGASGRSLTPLGSSTRPEAPGRDSLSVSFAWTRLMRREGG